MLNYLVYVTSSLPGAQGPEQIYCARFSKIVIMKCAQYTAHTFLVSVGCVDEGRLELGRCSAQDK